MKYEEKDSGLKKSTLNKLEQIAMNADFALEKRGGIDIRRNDEEDFVEISIRAIQRMMERAYMLGLDEAKKKN